MDFYCERVNLNFFNEPINILSNIFFLIASIMIVLNYFKFKTNKVFFIFPILIFLIGMGSASFHSLPNKITLTLDVLPIFLFSILFVFFFNIKILKLRNVSNFLFIILFFTLYFILPEIFNYQILNGSEYYLANDFTLLFYIFLIKREKKLLVNLISIFLIFNLSIYFRSIDNYVCENLNIGTHFIWHFLNSIVLYKLCLIFKHTNSSKYIQMKRDI